MKEAHLVCCSPEDVEVLPSTEKSSPLHWRDPLPPFLSFFLPDFTAIATDLDLAAS